MLLTLNGEARKHGTSPTNRFQVSQTSMKLLYRFIYLNRQMSSQGKFFSNEMGRSKLDFPGALEFQEKNEFWAIPKVKILCNLRVVKSRLRRRCKKLSTAQQLEPRFKTAKVMTFLFLEWPIWLNLNQIGKNSIIGLSRA